MKGMPKQNGSGKGVRANKVEEVVSLPALKAKGGDRWINKLYYE